MPNSTRIFGEGVRTQVRPIASLRPSTTPFDSAQDKLRTTPALLLLSAER
jgi:hypothetical protein